MLATTGSIHCRHMSIITAPEKHPNGKNTALKTKRITITKISVTIMRFTLAV